MAELLITLAIIGVVAAMTIPILIQDYQKKAIVTSLQKTMALLDSGIQNMMVDEGVFDDVTQTELFLTSNNGDYLQSSPIIAKYFKSTYSDGVFFEYNHINSNYFVECSGALHCSSNCREEFYDDEYVAKWPNKAGQSYQACQLEFKPGLIYHSSSPRILNNGVPIWILNTNNTGYSLPSPIAGLVYVDLNGHKGPNQYGYDIQKLGLKRDGHLFPINVDTDHEYFDYNGGTVGAKRIKDDGWKITY
ncbi:type II secretion system protein [bacterium]|nr:type II secretion system protein [bacterium]